MEGLTLSEAPARAPAVVGGGRSAGALVHIPAIVGMLTLMVPAVWFGHASLAGIGVMFACFGWAATAAVIRRLRIARDPEARGARGSVGDPFAMALLMAAPYLAMGIGGHAHGGGAASAAPSTPAMLVLGVLVVGGWAVSRGGGRRGARAERTAFWVCLVMMVGMLIAMCLPA